MREPVEGPRAGFQEVKGMAQGPGFCPEGEEVKKMENITKTKRRKIPPRELRIKAYNDVRKLRKRGLSHTKIREEIYRKYGVWISLSTISYWTRRIHSPYNGRRIPSLEMLEPSEDLAYVIGVRLGDGYIYEEGDDFGIGLKAKDNEFVEKFAICLSNVLGREPIRPIFKKNEGRYVVRVTSKTLYELLRKPIDLKRIKKYVEHCPKCTAAFLRGLFDSEGHVSKAGYIMLDNTDFETLVYTQKLLKTTFGIESTGPRIHKRKGTTTYDHRTGKQYKANEDCYYIYIRAKSLPAYHKHIGFTIRRKQKRLGEYRGASGSPGT
jgi:intein-encoded DNA endonuclease-like protein